MILANKSSDRRFLRERTCRCLGKCGILWHYLIRRLPVFIRSALRILSVGKTSFRIPKNYNGTQPTSRNVANLLSDALAKLRDSCQERPDLILASWPEIIGSKHASMTQAISFLEGVLTVKVKNSALYSLLSRHDKKLILVAFRQKFPKVNIQNIVFRMA